MSDEIVLAILHVSSPEGGEQDAPVSHSPFNIGRIQPNDLVLPSPKVSRSHARLLIEDDRMSLVDLNSSNGTFVGSQKLTPNEPYPLSYGASFEIGPFSLRLDPAPKGTSPADETGPKEDAQPETVPPDDKPDDRSDGRSAQDEAASAESGSQESTPSGPGPVSVGVIDLPAPVTPPPPPDGRVAVGYGPAYDQAIGLPGDHSRYLGYLPPIYSENPFLGKFLLGFEGVLVPIEQMVDNFDHYLDPLTAPAYFLDQLAAWLDLTLDEKWPLEKRRMIVNEVAELYRRRGTRWGLSRHLEIYTGVTPEIREPDDRPHYFEVSIKAPKSARLDRATLDRIIQANKPAHTTYKLDFSEK